LIWHVTLPRLKETEEHEPLAKALELARPHSELGTALHKMPVAHVRNGSIASPEAGGKFRSCRMLVEIAEQGCGFRVRPAVDPNREMLLT